MVQPGNAAPAAGQLCKQLGVCSIEVPANAAVDVNRPEYACSAGWELEQQQQQQ
jgi:hypothetical protein